LNKPLKSKEKHDERTSFQKLQGVIGSAFRFVGQLYVWLSLTIGFLWMFSAIFVMFFLGDFFAGIMGDPTLFFRIVFFPFTIAAWAFSKVAAAEMWAIAYGLAYIISMLFCLGVAYIIHRMRIRWKTQAK